MNVYEILEKHNNKIMDEIISSIKEGYKKIGIVQDTGLGKTYLSLELAFKYFEDKNILYVAPTKSLLEHIKNTYQYKMHYTDNMNMCTYSWLKNELSNHYDLIILDEFHRIGAEKWGEYIDDMFNSNKSTVFIGLSATPIRTDGIDTRFKFEKIINGLNLEEAMNKNIVPYFEKYVTSYFYNFLSKDCKNKIGSIESTSKGKLIEENLNVTKIIHKHCKDINKRKWIIFFSNIQDMSEYDDNICSWLDITKDQMVMIHSKQSSSLNKEQLMLFENDDNIRVIKSCNMLNEGIHVNNVTGIIMLRRTESEIIFRQQLGRCINIGSKTSSIVFDLVGNIKNRYRYHNKNFYSSKNDICNKFKSNKLFLNVIDHTLDLDQIFNKIVMRWSEDEDNLLRNNSFLGMGGLVSLFHKKGYDRTKDAIRIRANKLNIKIAKSFNIWSEDEDNLIRNNSFLGMSGLVSLFHKKGYDRTKEAIKSRASKLKISIARPNEWSEDEDNLIRNNSFLGIGGLLSLFHKKGYGRTKDTIRNRASKLNIKIAESISIWSEDEDNLIRNNSFLSIDDLVSLFHEKGYDRTESAIKNRITRLKINTTRPNEWSEDEDNLIRNNSFLCTGGLVSLFHKKGYGRTESAIRNRVNKLNIIKYSIWSEDEDNLIRNNSFLGIGDLVSLFHEKGYDRTKDAIKSRASKLKISIARPNEWSEDEDNLLRNNSFLGMDELFNLFHKKGYDRTKDTIRNRASKLNIKIARPNEWSEDEDNLLRNNSFLGMSGLVSLFHEKGYGRTECAIKNRITRLKISTVRLNGWSEDEDNLIRNNSFLSINDLVSLFHEKGYDRTESAIKNRITRLKISKKQSNNQ